MKKSNRVQQDQVVLQRRGGRVLFKTQEVAKLLNVHLNTIYSWIHSGKLQYVRLPGNTYAFTWDQIQDFIDARREQVKVRYPSDLAA
ncbi:MAG TPA: DNA-binding protein [Bacteroidetes bacterium]|nr:DNA-binding protein [Bacteroidota bacterium]